MLTNNIVSFEQPGPGSYCCYPDISVSVGMRVGVGVGVTL